MTVLTVAASTQAVAMSLTLIPRQNSHSSTAQQAEISHGQALGVGPEV